MNMLNLKIKVNWRAWDSMDLPPEIGITKKLNSKMLVLDGPLGRSFNLLKRVSHQVFGDGRLVISSPPLDTMLLTFK